MDADEFVRLCHREKGTILNSYFDPTGDSHVGALVHTLNLDPKQQEQLHEILDGALTEAIYTLLVALDGGGPLGGMQRRYVICDESGSTFGGDGELSARAFEHFLG